MHSRASSRPIARDVAMHGDQDHCMRYQVDGFTILQGMFEWALSGAMRTSFCYCCAHMARGKINLKRNTSARSAFLRITREPVASHRISSWSIVVPSYQNKSPERLLDPIALLSKKTPCACPALLPLENKSNDNYIEALVLCVSGVAHHSLLFLRQREHIA
jgi:hypothetical protein